MAAPRLADPARDPSPSIRLPLRPYLFAQPPLALYTNPNISSRMRDVFVFTFFVDAAIGATESRRTAAEVGRLAGVCSRTVRDCWDVLEAERFMTREREGESWVSRLTYEEVRLELDDTIPVYKGSRRGDKSTTHHAPLASDPRPIPKSASKRIPSSTTARIPSSARSASKRIPSSTTARIPSSAPALSRESLERTTTTLYPTHRAEASPIESSSSFLPLSEDGTPPGGPAASPEALGSPQSDRRVSDVESHAQADKRPSWAVLALSSMARSWPEAPQRHLTAWLANMSKHWRQVYKGKSNPDPGEEEGARVAALAVEYAAIMQCRPDRVWVYCKPALDEWANNGWDSSDIDAELIPLRPSTTTTRSAGAKAVEPAPERPEGLDDIEREIVALMKRTDPESARRREELVAQAEELVAQAQKEPAGEVRLPPRRPGADVDGVPSV